MTKKLISLALVVIMLFAIGATAFSTSATESTITLEDLSTATRTAIDAELKVEAKYYIYRVEGLDMSCCYDLLAADYESNGDGTYTVTIRQEMNYCFTCTAEFVEVDGEITVVISDQEVSYISNVWLMLINYGINYVKELIVDAISDSF